MSRCLCLFRSTPAAAWARITAGEAGAGARLATAEALAAWWLEERLHVDVCHFVKTVEVYQSAGSS